MWWYENGPHKNDKRIEQKEDQDRIFERFFCVDRSHSNKDSTGLGLTIVKHIVEECHGSIDVDSKLGEGTTFTLAFEMA